jgi:hypothetical protein
MFLLQNTSASRWYCYGNGFISRLSLCCQGNCSTCWAVSPWMNSKLNTAAKTAVLNIIMTYAFVG